MSSSKMKKKTSTGKKNFGDTGKDSTSKQTRVLEKW